MEHTMARTEYNDPKAETQYDEFSVAKKKLSNDMVLDNYTNGTMSTKAGSEAMSIDEQVRKKR